MSDPVDELARMRAKKAFNKVIDDHAERRLRGTRLHEEVERLIAEGAWELRVGSADEIADDIADTGGVLYENMFDLSDFDDDGGPDAA